MKIFYFPVFGKSFKNVSKNIFKCFVKTRKMWQDKIFIVTDDLVLQERGGGGVGMAGSWWRDITDALTYWFKHFE